MADDASNIFKHNSNKHETDIVTERRKHRFTLFIGYGEEAGALLKKFEQLKCRLGLGTNILFLKYLLQYFEENNSDFQPDDCKVESFDSDINRSVQMKFINNEIEYPADTSVGFPQEAIGASGDNDEMMEKLIPPPPENVEAGSKRSFEVKVSAATEESEPKVKLKKVIEEEEL